MIWVIANLSILESVLTDFEFVKCGPAPSTNNKSAFCSLHFRHMSRNEQIWNLSSQWTDLESVKDSLDKFEKCTVQKTYLLFVKVFPLDK